MASKRPSTSSNSTGVGKDSKKAKRGPTRSSLRERTYFTTNFTCDHEDREKTKIKYIYVYKGDNGVCIEFRNNTDNKGIVLTVDTWLTLQHKITEVTRRVRLEEEYSSRLTEVIYVKVNRFNQKPYVHIREYYMNHDREMRPTRIGISFNAEEWVKFESLLDRVGKHVRLVSSFSNCMVEDKPYTLVHVNTGDDGIHTYVWLEKMVELKSNSTDLNKILSDHMEVMRKKKEIVKKEQETKGKIEEVSREKCMYGAIITIGQEKNGNISSSENLDAIFNLYFHCGEEMGVDTFNPMTTYKNVMEKEGGNIENVLKQEQEIPMELELHVNLCKSLYTYM